MKEKNVFLICVLVLSFVVNGQNNDAATEETSDTFLAVQFQSHLSSSLLPSGSLLNPREITQIFDPVEFHIDPELNVAIFKRFNKSDIGLGVSVVFYNRALALSVPIALQYTYRLFEGPKSPFVHARLGHSFFITEGSLFSLGAGYQLNRFCMSLLYNNQMRNFQH